MFRLMVLKPEMMSISLVYIFKIMKSHSSRMTNQIQFPSGPLGMIEFTFHHLTTQIPLESCNLMVLLKLDFISIEITKNPYFGRFSYPSSLFTTFQKTHLHLNYTVNAHFYKNFTKL